MARLAKRLYAGPFTAVGSWSNVATVPAAKKWEIVGIWIANIGSASRIAQIQVAGVQLMWRTLSPGTTTVDQTFVVLLAGEHIALQGNVADLSVYFSGIEVDV